MSRQDHELAKKIVRYLDYGTEQFDQKTGERLLAARKFAMSHYKDKPERAWGLAWAGHAGVRFGGRRFDARYLIAIAALAIGLAGAAYWKIQGPANDTAEIDLGLLTDDLPINAYLDRGFDSWLKRSLR